MWKNFVRDYFTFSRKERIGIYTLLILIVGIAILPNFYKYFIHKKQYDVSEFEREIAALQILPADSNETNSFDNRYSDHKYPHGKSPQPIAENFMFDPNTASTDEWKRLGIRDKTIKTIEKYLSKGGHFYKPEDISKIWGLRPEDAKRLIPLIRIERNSEDQSFSKPSEKKELARKESIIGINSADTSAFIALPGIGSKLAQRIINFRNKLGGFASIEQVRETFGLPDSTFQKIRKNLVLDGGVKQININNCTLDELKSHPYIRYALANAIVQFRNQHGQFSSVKDVQKIMIMTDSVYRKLYPYLTIE